MSLPPGAVRREAFAETSRFRGEFYTSLAARRDEVFESADAVLCADGAVKSPVDLTLPPGHRCGHGAMYGGLHRGRIDVDRLQTMPAGLPLPRFDGGRLVLAVDVPTWLRSDAPCSAELLFCHVYGRAKTASRFIPSRPHSFVAVLEQGATSWTAIMDGVWLGPADDATAITAAQLRGVAERRIAAGRRKPGDPDTHRRRRRQRRHPSRLGPARPARRIGRPRPLRPRHAPAEPLRTPGVNGRPPKHSPEFRFTRPETWPEPAITTATATTNYGKAETQTWDRVHPRLTHRSAWLDHEGELPLIEGTLVQLKVEHLPKESGRSAGVAVVLEDRVRVVPRGGGARRSHGRPAYESARISSARTAPAITRGDPAAGNG